ncbi:MAG: US12 family protein [Parcubacteria group bacterium]|nr:US12 family protein [Parcubacteria group bacterium]
MAGIYTLGVTISYHWHMSWPLLLLSFVGSVVCIFIFRGSTEPIVSFAGVSGMSILMGLMTGPLVAHYTGPVVLNAIVTTAAIMVGMSLLGIIYPKSFEGMGPYLFGALLVLILGQLVQMLFVAFGFTQMVSMTAFAWLGVLIFTLYVAYDWSQALNQEYTLDNAIDASGGLILDAINLFIDLLRIYSGNND